MTVREIYQKLKRSDPRTRYKISLYSATIFNIAYALFKIASGVALQSLWFITFGVYYLLLVIIRVNLYFAERKTDKNLNLEWRKYLQTAYVIIPLFLVLSGIVTLIFRENVQIFYPDVIVYAIAAFTFYILLNNVINVFRYRKLKSHLVSAAKVVNMITSLISLLSLEIVMLSVFGGDSSVEFKNVIIIATGAALSAIFIAISFYMIARAKKNLKKSQ